MHVVGAVIDVVSQGIQPFLQEKNQQLTYEGREILNMSQSIHNRQKFNIVQVNLNFLNFNILKLKYIYINISDINLAFLSWAWVFNLNIFVLCTTEIFLVMLRMHVTSCI